MGEPNHSEHYWIHCAPLFPPQTFMSSVLRPEPLWFKLINICRLHSSNPEVLRSMPSQSWVLIIYVAEWFLSQSKLPAYSVTRLFHIIYCMCFVVVVWPANSLVTACSVSSPRTGSLYKVLQRFFNEQLRLSHPWHGSALFVVNLVQHLILSLPTHGETGITGSG
jgi:hypothetical protein